MHNGDCEIVHIDFVFFANSVHGVRMLMCSSMLTCYGFNFFLILSVLAFPLDSMLCLTMYAPLLLIDCFKPNFTKYVHKYSFTCKSTLVSHRSPVYPRGQRQTAVSPPVVKHFPPWEQGTLLHLSAVHSSATIISHYQWQMINNNLRSATFILSTQARNIGFSVLYNIILSDIFHENLSLQRRKLTRCLRNYHSPVRLVLSGIFDERRGIRFLLFFAARSGI